MVGIFITWILVSVAMFQLGLGEVDTSAQGTVVIANKPSKAAPTSRATTTPTTPVPRTTEPQVVESTTPPTTTESATGSVTTPGSTTTPTRKAPKREAPTPAAPTSAAPTPAAPTTVPPGEQAPTTALPPPTSATQAAPTPPAPTTEVSTPSASTTAPLAGPRLVLTASVAKKGTLASTLLTGLTPAGTLTEIAITSGRGALVGMSPNGDYVFEAPSGRGITVITFTYTQAGIPVTGNRLTISTE